MIHVQSFKFNPFEENTYVVFDETREACIVDPGCYEKEEQNLLADFISAKNLNVSCRQKPQRLAPIHAQRREQKSQWDRDGE